MKNRQRMLLLVLLWLLPAYMSMALEIHTNAEAVNIAGKQRMYTMRMLRDYIMIGEGLKYKNPEKDLNKTIEAFSEAGKALEGYIKDPTLKEEVKKVHQIWLTSRKMFSMPPKKEQALKHAKEAIAFRKKLNEFVTHLAAHYGGGAAEVVNTSGKLRAVSQSLAAFYLLKSWDIPEADMMLKKPMQNFRDALDYLEKAPQTTADMQPLLKKLEKIYLFFQVMDEASSTSTPVLAVKKTDQMLKVANELTEKYVKSQK